MKKVTFFIYDMYTGGGTEKVVSLIANELSKKYDVEIISLYKTADNPFYKLNECVKLKNILTQELTPFKWYIPYLQYKLKKELKKEKTDVFISAGMKYICLTIFMRKYAKYIAWEHYNSFTAKTGSVTWYGRKLAAKYADNIVVLTKRDKENNIRLFKNENKIKHIYNPIEKSIQTYEYNIDSKKIVSSGRLIMQKGFDMLIDVATKVFNKHPDWEWHIYGDGEDRESLEQKVKEKNMQKHVKFLGRTNKMNELYREYAMFVMTSRFEGFAMVNIEAHYAKLPIISFDCNCGPDEIIQEGINGYVVECFDIDKMADKINYLIENPKLRKQMSDNTLLDKEKLNIENIIKEWEKII